MQKETVVCISSEKGDEEELEVVVEDIRKERRKYVARVTVPECN